MSRPGCRVQSAFAAVPKGVWPIAKSNVRARAVRESEHQVEKRRHDRAPVVVRVDYSTVDSFFSEFSRNINEGGLFLETDAPHPADTLVSLQFQLPGSEEPVRVMGRVVRVSDGDSPGMGIEFENLDAGNRARIDELVLRLRTLEPSSRAPRRAADSH